jgi:hypothetical protein
VAGFDISGEALLGSITRVCLLVYPYGQYVFVHTCDMFGLSRFGVEDEGCKKKHRGQGFSSPNHTCHLQERTKELKHEV